MWRAASLALVGTLILFACGDDDAVSTGTPGPGTNSPDASTPATGAAVAQADFIAQYTSAECDHIGPCCTKYSATFDLATCQATVTRELTRSYGTPAPELGEYDPVAAGNCIAATKAALDACEVAKESAATLEAASDDEGSTCSRIFKGTKQLGDTCKSSKECVVPPSGSVTCLRTCREVQLVADGAACIDGTENAATTPGPYTKCQNKGSECVPTDDSHTTYVCQAAAAVGAACDKGACVDGAFCSRNKPYTCTALKTAGGDCDTSAECAKGLFCDQKTCKAQLASGAACVSSISDQCLSRVCYQGKCFSELTVVSPSTCADPLK